VDKKCYDFSRSGRQKAPVISKYAHDKHPHELRHSAASLMLASGVKLQVVREVLGHASIRMTADVYGHILAPDREAAADAIDQALWNGV
jgi:integrase